MKNFISKYRPPFIASSIVCIIWTGIALINPPTTNDGWLFALACYIFAGVWMGYWAGKQGLF